MFCEFSFRSYLFRSGTSILFASLGDSINHLTINVADKNNLFDTFTILITTGDMKSYKHIVQGLHEHGVSSDILNLDSIPADLVTMGTSPISGDSWEDLFVFLDCRIVKFFI